MHDWIGPAAAAEHHAVASTFHLTDDERELRDLAYPLIEPPFDRQKWDSVAGEYGLNGTFRAAAAYRPAYFKHLTGPDFRSPSSRYAKLLDDVHNDDARLPAFFATATRVTDIDRKRIESLHYITDLPRAERENARRRVRENAAIVSLVIERLKQRASSYRYALERLVISTPAPEAADAERAINQLKSDIARYGSEPTPTWARQKSLADAD
ncbi:MAG TPA: hypothetical protein VE224_15945 [Pseudolabrys sp.]|nr:hypothetical protein [Pseudolabrys sp.]